MGRVFSFDYSSLYDTVYEEKDYLAEVKRVLSWCDIASDAKRLNVLDLGCGTGRHALEIAKLDHHVSCLDQSNSMLDFARRRFDSAGLVFNGQIGNVQDFALEKKFDLVTMMFAVLNYITDKAELIATLNSIRAHLVKGGVFVFDTWYGPGVEFLKPSKRTKQFWFDKQHVTRTSNGELDVDNHLVNVSIKMVAGVGSNERKTLTDEVHTMRYFFPDELEQLMLQCGLRLKVIEDFDNPGSKPTTNSWSMFCVAEAA